MSSSGEKRKIIHSEGRAIIAKVFHFLQEEYNFMKSNNFDNCDLSPLSNVRKRTAEATGVCERTVTKILKEERNLASGSTPGEFPSPLSKRRKRENKVDNISNYLNANVIRSTIQNFHVEHKTIPTLAKLQSAFREKFGFDGCLNTLRTILIKMGYEWCKTDNKRKVLQESHDIRYWRFKYLKKINQYRLEGRPIVYTDQMVVSPPRDIKKEDTPVLKKLDIGTRFIIVHAGSKDGFIANASLVYEASSTSEDYHSKMSRDNYYKWLEEKLLPNLPENGVLVMDNACYQNIDASKIPTSTSPKGDMKQWLTENSITYDENSRKVELYDLIKKNKTQFKIDDIIKSKGFRILQLPPYHPELNAMVNIWGVLKNNIASKNIDHNMTGLEAIYESINNIDSNTWYNTCKHIEETERDYMNYFDNDFVLVKDESDSENEASDRLLKCLFSY